MVTHSGLEPFQGWAALPVRCEEVGSINPNQTHCVNTVLEAECGEMSKPTFFPRGPPRKPCISEDYSRCENRETYCQVPCFWGQGRSLSGSLGVLCRIPRGSPGGRCDVTMAASPVFGQGPLLLVCILCTHSLENKVSS